MSNDKRSSTTPEVTSFVNIERADFILSTGGKNDRTILLHLRNLVDDIKAREKKNRVFYETVALVEPSYLSKRHTLIQKLQGLKSVIRKMVEVDLVHLQNKSKSLEKKMPMYEEKLNSSREYAEQRRNKKAMRERQYHQLYYVPVLSQEFRKKYIRARDKNSIAEGNLCDIREKMDSCQKDISSTAKLISEINKKVETMTTDCNNIKNGLQKIDKVLQDLHEELGYWKSFDRHQSTFSLKAVDDLIQIILKNGKTKLMNTLNINNNWIKVFRMRCYEYGQAEQQGEQRWNQRLVDFTCSRCMMNQSGWPTPDKVNNTRLLCSQCYKDTRTSMIVEKKMNKFNEKIRLDRNQKPTPCKPETFMKPLPNKPAFQKMFTMIKGS